MCPNPVRVVDVTVEARVGGTVRFDVDDSGTSVLISGQFLTIDRPRLLRFTWSNSNWEDPTRASIVNVTFDPVGGTDETLMSIEHSLLPTSEFESFHGAGSPPSSNSRPGWNQLCPERTADPKLIGLPSAVVVRWSCLIAGIAVWAVATFSAIGVYAPVLFWVRALQVVLLLFVAPFLLALGRPVTALCAVSAPINRLVQRALETRLVRVAVSPVTTSVAMLVIPWLLYLTPPWYVAR